MQEQTDKYFVLFPLASCKGAQFVFMSAQLTLSHSPEGGTGSHPP